MSLFPKISISSWFTEDWNSYRLLKQTRDYCQLQGKYILWKNTLNLINITDFERRKSRGQSPAYLIKGRGSGDHWNRESQAIVTQVTCQNLRAVFDLDLLLILHNQSINRSNQVYWQSYPKSFLFFSSSAILF